MLVIVHIKAMSLHNFHLHLFEFRAVEFNDLAAGQTNQMIMMCHIDIELGVPVRKLPFHSNPGLHQEFECSEDGGWIDVLPLFAQMFVEFIDSVMSVELEKFPDDELPLWGESPFVLAHKTLKLAFGVSVHTHKKASYCNSIAIANENHSYGRGRCQGGLKG